MKFAITTESAVGRFPRRTAKKKQLLAAWFVDYSVVPGGCFFIPLSLFYGSDSLAGRGFSISVRAVL